MKSRHCSGPKPQWKKLNLLDCGSLLIICMGLLAVSCSNDKPADSIGKSNPVSWNTGIISLNADDFYIEAAGVKYLANVSNVDVGGSSSTLELEWIELDTDMRLYIYFDSNSADWWSDEIRTYDGAKDDGTRWIYYSGEFFKSPLGTQFQGDVDLTSTDSDNGVVGKLHFKNARLLAF